MPLTPAPLQVPPPGPTLRITIVSVKHTRGGTPSNTMFGNAFTVIVNVLLAPVQVMPPLVNVGVTVIVAVIGPVVGLTVTKAGTVPMPLAPKPIEVLLFVQLYSVPATGPLNGTAVVVAPAQSIWLAGWFTLGVGFTVIVKLTDEPPQPVELGVTVIVAVCTVVVVLVAVKAAILPVPDAARPIPVLLFVQLYVVPGGKPVKLTGAVVEPLHSI